MNKVWSEGEHEFIKINASTMKDHELATELSKLTGRRITMQSVRKQRQKLHLAKIPGRGKCGLQSSPIKHTE